MSEIDIFPTQQVVLVEADIAQQVVLVEVEVSQGPPGPQGPAGPNLPPPGVPDLGKVGIVRDKGAGPVWAADLLLPSDVHTLGALAALNTVDTAHIVDGAVTGPKLAAAAVDTINLVGGAVTVAKLAANAVSTANIQDANVTAPKLAAGAAAGNIGYVPANKAGETFGGLVSAPVAVGQTLYAGQDADIEFSNVPATSASFYFSRLNAGAQTRFFCALATGNLDYFVRGAALPALSIAGDGRRLKLTDGVGFSSVANGYTDVIFNEALGVAFRVDYVDKKVSYLVGGAPQFVVQANGAGHFNGSLSVGPSSRLLLSEGAAAAYGQVTFDNSNNYALRSDWVTGVLTYFAAGIAVLTIAPNGTLAANGNVTAGGDVVAAGAVKAGNGTRLYMDTDNGSFSRIMLDAVQGSYVIYSANTHKFVFVTQNVVVASIDAAGNLVCKGAITPNGTPG